ncbi:MAG: hypothetical protein Q7S61_00535 [bacterium]|nr:hypothetical protein [bacterium]
MSKNIPFYLGIIVVLFFLAVFFLPSLNKTKIQIPTPTPTFTIPSISPFPTNKTQLQQTPTPTTPSGSTYYKTEMRCQNNTACYVCPPQTADSIQSACQQGECMKGYCYWKHTTDQCQKGYVKVCEAGMCECLRIGR